MMLDKGQIKDWDGGPEDAIAPPAQPRVAKVVSGAGEAVPTGEWVKLSDAQVKARKRRGQWIALALFAFVILVFVLTMAKVGGGAGVPEVYHVQGGQ